MAFLDRAGLEKIGFRQLGKNVQVSDKASIYNAANISIGDNSRIDDFCVISAGPKGIRIGRHVHIAAFCMLVGREEILLDDFCGLSARTSIYSNNDDFSGAAMTNPTVPLELLNMTIMPVRLGKHVVVGAGTVILPGVTLETGCAVGALSLVKESFAEFSVVAGVPAKKIAERKRDLLALEASGNA